MEADPLVILTDIDGLYEEDPRKNPDAKRIPVVRHIDGHIREIAGAAVPTGGTGGMSTKITAAVVATEAGIDCCVINGEIRSCYMICWRAGRSEPGLWQRKKDKKPLSQRRN